MGFAEYPGIEEVYVLHHTEGFGVMESQMVTLEIVGQSNSEDELVDLGHKLYPRSGTGWDYDGWVIHINICSEKGRELYDVYKIKSATRRKEWENDMRMYPDKYTSTKFGGYTITMKKFPELEDAAETSSFTKMMFLLPSGGGLLSDKHMVVIGEGEIKDPDNKLPEFFDMMMGEKKD